MKIPSCFAGLRAVFNDEELPDEHFFSHEMRQWQFGGKELLTWYDERYRKVFQNDRFEIEGNRRLALFRDLCSVDKFEATDAEVQAAATILKHPSVRLIAKDEEKGSKLGTRTADYLLFSPGPIEIEVRMLREFDSVQELDRVRSSIIKRLENISDLPEHTGLLVRVNQVRIKGKIVLTPEVEKRLVHCVRSALDAGEWLTQRLYATVQIDGEIKLLKRATSTDSSLVWIEIEKTELSRFIGGYSGLRTPPGEHEIFKALQRKASRKQRSGTCPWIIVLDASDARKLSMKQLCAGAMHYFGDSKSISAVVVQQRRLRPDGFVPLPGKPWLLRFISKLISNPNARFSLTDNQKLLFEELYN